MKISQLLDYNVYLVHLLVAMVILTIEEQCY